MIGLLTFCGFLLSFNWEFPSSYDLPPHSRLSFHYNGIFGLVSGVSGSYITNQTITAFISDYNGRSYWDSYHQVPSNSLWNQTGMEGTFDVNFPSWGDFYVVFGNTASSYTSIHCFIKTKVSLFGYVLFDAVIIFLAVLFIVIVKVKLFPRKPKYWV